MKYQSRKSNNHRANRDKQSNHGAKSNKPLQAGSSPIPTKAPGEFPMRINKYIAWKGISTRRDADKLIQKKSITINGRFAVLGDQVNVDDVVQVRNSKKAEDYVYYAYNKPRGLRTEESRKSNNDIMHTIPLAGVFSVDSLDQNTEGLIILTNDRRIIDRMMNQTHHHEKEYYGTTIDPLRTNFKQKLHEGIKLGDGSIGKCYVNVIDQKHFTAIVTDNTNPLRQMCALSFAELENLKRIRIMNIELGKLPANAYRKIEDIELSTFLNSLGLQ